MTGGLLHVKDLKYIGLETHFESSGVLTDYPECLDDIRYSLI